MLLQPDRAAHSRPLGMTELQWKADTTEAFRHGHHSTAAYENWRSERAEPCAHWRWGLGPFYAMHGTRTMTMRLKSLPFSDPYNDFLIQVLKNLKLRRFYRVQVVPKVWG